MHYRCDEDERLEPRPRRHRGQDHREHARAGDHQPQQPDGRGLQRGDRQGAGRHRAPPRARRPLRRDLREDPLRGRPAPPRRDVRRPRRALPDLQRAVQGLPRVRLPRRLGDDLRSQGDRHRLPRGPDPDRQHAHVRQRARAARDPDRARRLPVGRGVHRPRRPLLRAVDARRPAAQRDPGRLQRDARRARSTASRASTPRSTPIDDDQEFVIDLLRAKKILVTHGTGFNWFEPDHFRLVTLPEATVLEEAIGRIGDFLATRR